MMAFIGFIFSIGKIAFFIIIAIAAIKYIKEKR